MQINTCVTPWIKYYEDIILIKGCLSKSIFQGLFLSETVATFLGVHFQVLILHRHI